MRAVSAGVESGERVLYEAIDACGLVYPNAGATTRGVWARGDVQQQIPTATFTGDVWSAASGGAATGYADIGNGIPGYRHVGVAGILSRGSPFAAFPIERKPNTAPILPAAVLRNFRYRWRGAFWRTGTNGDVHLALTNGSVLSTMLGGGVPGVGFVAGAGETEWRAIYRAVNGGPIITDIATSVPVTAPIEFDFDYVSGPVPSLLLKLSGRVWLSFIGDANMPLANGTDLGLCMSFANLAATGTTDWVAQQRYSISEV